MKQGDILHNESTDEEELWEVVTETYEIGDPDNDNCITVTLRKRS